MLSNTKKVVVIGGGTGTYTVLSALKSRGFELSAVVSMCDDGGSTGRLRDDYGVLPAGDIRRSLVALAADETKARELFEYRFEDGDLAGHNFGNIFLAAAEKLSGNFYDAVKLAGTILNIEGNVFPVTLQDTRLFAELEDGSVVTGEKNIDIPKHNPKLAIKRIFLKPKNPKANPDAINAIKNADVIIVGPGDLYTSILPNFLVGDISNSARSSKAKKIYICNLMTKYGETNNFLVQDFINEIEKYIGKNILDYILVNSKKPHKNRLGFYGKYNTRPVLADDTFNHPNLHIADLATNSGYIRHDKEKLAKTILQILKHKS